MTKAEKKELIEDLLDNIRQDIIDKIDNEVIPQNWDGIELRHFIVNRAESFDYIWQRQSRRRKADYNNDIAINNLYS